MQWVETVEDRRNILVGNDEEKIKKAILENEKGTMELEIRGRRS